jgi:CubicO group peptidase (beta-lactamase class C family)
LGLSFGVSLALPAVGSTQSLDTDLAALRQQYNIPVLAYSLFNQGQPTRTIVLGAGKSTPMRWGSNTKTITAITVLQLAKAGLIDLNAPLQHYLDPKHWTNRWRTSDPVRVIHLLELTAGFTDLSSAEFNYQKPISLSDALALAPEHRTTMWPPGLQHSYSNMTLGLTQLLIETVSGLNYSSAVTKYVLSPLNMRNTNFSPRPDLPGGFKADGVTPIVYWHMTFPAYGAMNAPIEDINQLVKSVLNRSGKLGRSTIDHLLLSRSSASARSGFTFDYASGFYPRVRNGLVWYGHGGDADGYRSRVALLPDQQRGYVAVINTDNPKALRRIEQRIEEHISRQVPALAEPSMFELSPCTLEALTGTYYPASTRFGLTSWIEGKSSHAEIVTNKDGKTLTFIRNKRRTQLIPVAQNKFRRLGDPVATLAFIKQGEQRYLQGELGNFFKTSSCPEYTLGVLRSCRGQK